MEARWDSPEKLGTAVQANESYHVLKSRQNQLCKHNNLILPKSSHHQKLTESPRAISDPYDIQTIWMGLADILQDSQETHHIPGSRTKTDRTC